jgi:hypothetical protein
MAWTINQALHSAHTQKRSSGANETGRAIAAAMHNATSMGRSRRPPNTFCTTLAVEYPERTSPNISTTSAFRADECAQYSAASPIHLAAMAMQTLAPLCPLTSEQRVWSSVSESLCKDARKNSTGSATLPPSACSSADDVGPASVPGRH